MAGLDRTFRTGLSLGRGPSPVDAMLPLQLYGGARAGRACQSPARIWLRRAEETEDQLLRGVGSSSQTRRGSLLLRVLVWESSESRAIKRTAEMHYSGTLLLAASLSVTSDRYERCCDVLRWNEGLDEWGRLSQDGSIVCLSGDGVAGVIDLPISTLTLAPGGRFVARHPGSWSVTGQPGFQALNPLAQFGDDPLLFRDDHPAGFPGSPGPSPTLVPLFFYATTPPRPPAFFSLAAGFAKFASLTLNSYAGNHPVDQLYVVRLIAA